MMLYKKLKHIPIHSSMIFFKTENICISNFLNIYRAISIVVQVQVVLYIENNVLIFSNYV